MKYLVTGATGFIGPYLVKQLASRGHQCRCLVRSKSKAEVLKDLGVELVEGDILQPETLKGSADGMDGLFHLATLGHASHFKVPAAMFKAVNVTGTVNVMAEALKAEVSRVVHCSSVAAMGICKDMPVTEESLCQPHHPYGISKLNGEKEVLHLISTKKLPAVIIRFSMVYGPGDWRDILKLTKLTKKGLFPKVGNRPKLTPLIHVDDAVNGLLLAAEKAETGKIYLLTNPESLPFDDIRKILQKALGVRRLPLYVPEWLALTIASLIEKIFPLIGRVPPVSRKNIESTLADRVFSIDKAQKELNFHPQIDPEIGLTETVKWYQEKGWI